MSSAVPEYVRHRCAVALNNIGVSLMEKRCYQQAIYTLRDSIALFRDVVPSSSPEAPSRSMEDVSEMLSTAWRRAAHPENQKSLSSVQVACYDETNCQAKKILEPILRHIASSQSDLVTTTLAALYISSSSFSEGTYCVDKERANFESALAIYNFGVAHICLSKQTKKKSVAIKFHGTALKLFALAQGILQEQCSSVREFSMIQSELPLEAWLSMIVLGAMAYTWVEMGNFSKAKTALLRLARFISDNVVLEPESNLALAAAAA
jgi:hypothetical protein